MFDQTADQKIDDTENIPQKTATSSLLWFLISFFKPPSDEATKIAKYNDNQMVWHNQLNLQRKQDFFQVCLALQNLTEWMEGNR